MVFNASSTTIQVSKNRQKARELAIDTYQTVQAIHEFYAKYTSAFVKAQDLQKLVEGLRRSLTEIVEKCKAMDPEPEKGRLLRGVAGLRGWPKRDELEARLTDLNIRAQQCQIKFMTLATLSVNIIAHEIRTTTARMDANISSMHHCVVVRRMTTDFPVREGSQPPHVDPIVPGSSVGILKSPNPQLEDDIVKHAFLGVQVKEIDKLLSSLLQDPNISFHILPSQPDGPTQVCVSSQLYISWEIVQRHAALESAQLIDTIQTADASTSIVDVSDALTLLGHRYKHLGMHHEALTLSALALQLARLAVEAYPHSDGLRRGLATCLDDYASLMPDCRKSKVEATKCMIEAVSIGRQLVAKLPLPSRKINLAITLSRSSLLAGRAGDLDTAESHSVEALEIILDVMGAPPGTIPDANAPRWATGWAGVERNGVLTVEKRQDQAIFIYPTILHLRFHWALARKRFSDAYKYAMASRNAYQIIADRHPRSYLNNLLDITTELLNEWADPLRSGTDTITLCTKAISYLSATPSRQGVCDGDSLFGKYTVQAKLSIYLYETDNALEAVKAQQMASLYWDHYSSTYPEMARSQISSLFEAQHAIDTLHGQVQLYYVNHLPRLPASTSLVVDFRRFSTARVAKHPTLSISDQTYQSIRGQAKTIEWWFQDAHPAGLSAQGLGGPKTKEPLMCGQFNAVIAFCFARLGDVDAAYQAARRAADASGRVVVAQGPVPSSTEDEEKIWWNVVAWVLNTAAWVSEACIVTPNDPRWLLITQDAVALVKSLFPSQEPICVPSVIDTTGILDNIGTVLTACCRHLEILRQMDEFLSISKSNLEWYTTRAPSSYPTNRDYRHISLVLNVAHSLIYAGQWSTALTHTTTVLHAIVSKPTLEGCSGMKYNVDWWTLVLLTHCSILTELGRVEVAAECITQGIEALTNVDSRDECSWKGPAMVRKALITSLLGQEDLETQIKYAGNCARPDFQSIYGGQIAYYLLAPARVHSGLYLDASCVFADIGDHKRAIVNAQEALSSIATLATENFNKWQDVALMQQRTDSIIALVVAFILGGHIQDAAELFPPLFDIYNKELQYQRNLYPGYAIALRLAGWVFDKVGNVTEARRIKRQEAGLEYLFDEEADEEMLRVIRIRLEMEERRAAIRRVREILGVKPYQPEPAT